MPSERQLPWKAIAYCASVNCPGIETKKYFGLCETDFKSRFNNHKHTFRNKNIANATELSKYIWNCKRSNLEHKVIWDVAATSRPWRSGAKYCSLCQSEKLAIIQSDPNTTLNKRSEIFNKCRHKNKFICFVFIFNFLQRLVFRNCRSCTIVCNYAISFGRSVPSFFYSLSSRDVIPNHCYNPCSSPHRHRVNYNPRI